MIRVCQEDIFLSRMFESFSVDLIEMYKQIIALKEQNPDLKIMLAVGGWNHGSAPFTQMVATEQSRTEFVENSYKFMKKYGFDGLDLGKKKLK
jgi:chitinase